MVANKVTRVINCAGLQIPNHWEPIGVQYMTFYWHDKDGQLILDPKNEVAFSTFDFIEGALEKTESVLVSSL